MQEILYIGAGAAAGAAAAWLVLRGRYGGVIAELRGRADRSESETAELRRTLDEERTSKVAAETELRGLREQKEYLDLMKKELSDTFEALSAAALRSSSEDFLRLAKEHLGQVVVDTKGKLGEHREAIDGIVKPLNEMLKKYDEQIRELERRRQRDYTSLDEQIKMLATTHTELKRETGNLVTALRKPHIRGRWGEVTLRNVVEHAGMSAHCDFTEQAIGGDGRIRPDMVVHLPGGRDIVVDSKVSLEALLDASSARTDEERAEALKRHAQQVKKHVAALGSKSYWAQFEASPEFVVCFMGEAALVAALESEPALMEDSMQKKVLITTPTSLVALLSAIAYGWRQEQVTKNAEAIAQLGKELYERVRVWAGHMSDIGTSLGRSVETYNKAVGSMESRVLPSVRKFKEMGATGAEEIPQTRQVEQTPRKIDLFE